MSSEEINKKKRVRAGHRGSVTRTLTQVQGTLDAEERNTSKLSLALRTLKEKLAIICELDAAILDATVREQDVYSEIEEADIYREKMELAISEIELALSGTSETRSVPTQDGLSGSRHDVSRSERGATTESRQSVIVAEQVNPSQNVTAVVDDIETPSDTNSSTSTVPVVATRSTRETRIRLPKLELKRFNGELTNWMAFWDSFEAAIHHNDELSSVDKFNYLNTLLEDSAAAAVAGLTLTSANYGEAVDILKKRFGNKQMIIAKHMDILMNLEASFASPSAEKSRREGGWDLSAVMKILDREIDARERATANPGTCKKIIRSPTTAAALLSTDPSVHCVYCDQTHLPSQCRNVADVKARKQILLRSGRCFVCLKKGHVSKNCRSSAKCFNCQKRHHISICVPEPLSTTKPNTPSQPQNVPVTSGSNSSNRASSSIAMYISTKTPVLLQTARTTVCGPSASTAMENVRMILDGGSQRSYITGQLREQLALPTLQTETLMIKPFGSEGGRITTCDVVQVGVKTKRGTYLELQLLVVPLICEPLTGQPMTCARERYSHLNGLELADSGAINDAIEISMLIGADYYWEIVTGRICRGRSGPTAIETKLGWVLSGPVPGYNQEHTSVLFTAHVLQTETSEASLDERLKSFWDLETLGIRNDECSVYDHFMESIRFHGGRYCVRLPWKDPHCMLPENYDLSQKRLYGLLNRLRHNTGLLREYDGIIRDQIAKGIVEIVKNPSDGELGRIHYLPHHPVIRQDKQTTRIRIVYDASARSNGPSLNDTLYVGPSFGQNIMDIMLRFRVYKVALTADIEKAFLMIKVADEDRDALRFLWLEDVGSEIPRVKVFRFTRVVFGVASSPFLLNATLKYHIQRYSASDQAFISKFQQSIYVDDVTFGACSVNEAFELYTKSKSYLAEGGFNLRKFTSNSTELMKCIDVNEREQSAALSKDTERALVEEDRSYVKDTIGTGQQQLAGVQKVLGLCWDTITDELVFDFSHIAQLANLEPRKRDVVSLTTRMYDPLGLLAPVITPFKVFFQKICGTKIGWDDFITGELLSDWRRIVNGLHGQPLRIPRCWFQDLEGDMVHSLQGFCDASKDAYAAVVYLRSASSSGISVRLIFVASKTRVAPTKGHTIPRLELLGALLLVKLMSSVTRALDPVVCLTDPSCFTDSKVVLFWIQGRREWRQFVQNRVNEIRELLPVGVWKHCCGNDNPADLPSRGVSFRELIDSPVWLNGPIWLSDSGSMMPNVDEEEPPEECLKEMKGKGQQATTSVHNLLLANKSTIDVLMKCEDFGTLKRLLRVTAHVIKFVKIFKARSKNIDTTPDENLTGADLMKAELYWIKAVQCALQCNERFSMWKQQFGLFLDELGVWRCGGRLSNAELPQASKHPILLDNTHHFTVLVIRECHERVMHNGVQETLNELRSKYWIVRGRSIVRKLLHQCLLCKRLEGHHYRTQPKPPLPPFRVQQAHPFSSCGVDYAGPLYTRDTSKVWICLFTCCATRAVHLELVPDMTAEAFLLCFRRFTARRGVPCRVISDNSKTFKSGSRLIFQVLDCPEVMEYFSDVRVQWVYNLEKAPWLLCLPDIQEDLADPDFSDMSTSTSINQRVNHLKMILEHFWKRWRKEYLQDLRDCHRYSNQLQGSGDIKVGDVVVVHSDKHPRTFWKTGVIEQVLSGQDGLVRGARVRVRSRNGSILLNRPLQLLYPLEVSLVELHSDTRTAEQDEIEEQQGPDETGEKQEGRPKRMASALARERIRILTEQTYDQSVD
ncbi:hypothetical protein EMCRGX_G025680 [Ephydatia muelleri]|eukprot:Em0050g19a